MQQKGCEIGVADIGARNGGEALPVEQRQDAQEAVPAAREEDGAERGIVCELVKGLRALAVATGEETRSRAEISRRNRNESEPGKLGDAAGEALRIDRTGERRDADTVTGAYCGREVPGS